MKVIIIGILLVLSACSTYPANTNKRQVTYIQCITHLNNEGIKAELIERICDKALEK